MKHNNSKNEMIEDLDRLMGLLISVRTVETSPLNTNHWVNSYIDRLSIIKFKAIDDKDLCPECDGSGAVYPAYAEVLSDAEPCPCCRAYGFNSNRDFAALMIDLKEDSKNNSSINKFIQSIMDKPLYSL
jgi:hypothetical protein